jgi:medium-chain acyl-[acyl-carrier-protein] hydrolase
LGCTGIAVIAVNDWIARQRGLSTPRMQLFCFPFAGGSPAAFRGWMTELLKDAGIEVCAARLPGRDSRLREKPLRSVFEVVVPLVAAMAEIIDRPYLLYGHSLGAILAFEAARELRRKGVRQPEHLIVSAGPAPQLPWGHSPMHHLDQEAFLAEIQERYGPIASPILNDLDLLELLLPGLRGDVEMRENYQYSPEAPLDFPVTAYGGIQDQTVTPASLEAWREQTTSEFQLYMVQGQHFCLPAIRERLIGDLLPLSRATRHSQ